MPCYNGGSEPPIRTVVETVYRDTGISEAFVNALQKRCDITTRVACELFTEYEKQNKPIPNYAQEWWDEHKKLDAERKAKAEYLSEKQKHKPAKPYSHPWR